MIRKQESNKIFKEHINTVCSLTNYPPQVVEDILKASNLILLEQLADTVIDNDEFPEEVDVQLPKLGTLTIERLTNGRRGDIRYRFLPTREFHQDIQQAYYYGETPIIKLIQNNLNETIKFRLDNIIREGGD